jgi:hypothetical protein
MPLLRDLLRTSTLKIIALGWVGGEGTHHAPMPVPGRPGALGGVEE